MRGLEIFATTHLSRNKIESIAERDKLKLKKLLLQDKLNKSFYVLKLKPKPFFIPLGVWVFLIKKIVDIETNV